MRKSVSLLTLSLSLVAIGAVNIISLSQDSVVKSQKEEPTLQTGVLTEKQKRHSKLYKEYRRDKKIPELTIEHPFDFGITIGTPLPAGEPGVSQPTFSDRITTLACDSDAIVVGEVKSKASQLTEDQDFIFTDYEVLVEEVIKNNATDPIVQNTEISITNPGGRIRLNNRIVEARDMSFPPMIIGGRYLLFLKSTSISGGYKAVNKESRFHITDSNVQTLANDKTSAQRKNLGQTSTFLMQVREAVSNNCVGKGKGGVQ